MKKKVKIKRRVTSKRRSWKPERGGISKGVLGIIIIVLIAGAAFFFVNKNNGGGNPISSLVKAPLNPVCELKDPELCKFMNNWQTIKDYSMTSTSTDKAHGAKMESVFEISGKNTHMIGKENGKDNYEMISIDNSTYTKDYSDNTWWKMTYDPEKNKELTKEFMKDDVFDEDKAVEDKTEYKLIGKEACGNMTCFKYQVIDANDTSTTQYIWFDDRDYLLRKQSTVDADGNSMDVMFAYGSVTVSVPSPVKEGNAESMYAPKMSAEDAAAFEKMKQESAEQMKEYQSENNSSPEENTTPDEGPGY